MEQERDLVLIISTIVIILIAIFIVILFSVFQRRKNKLLQEQKEAKKRFEQEITETQIEIREQTLQNISWELHDNIGQLLTLAKIQLQDTSIENIEEAKKTIHKSLQEVRALSKLINPQAIRKLKLKKALQLEVDRFNRLNYIASTLKVTGKEQGLGTKTEVILFRILQEFLSNTIKHSKASELSISLNYQKEQLEIIAKDNGVGFNLEKNTIATKGIGLQNIQSRAKLIHADINVFSAPKKGTKLIIHYPYTSCKNIL